MSSFITDQSPAQDYEKITVSSTAIGPTAAKLLINQAGGGHKRAVRVFCTVETASVRTRFDGTAPTSTLGHLLAAADYLVVDGEANVANLKFIAAAGDGAVHITYFYNM